MHETHISVLLVGFDKTTWGGSANKLHFIPEEKQAHLKKYYCSDAFEEVERNLAGCMRWFQSDIEKVFRSRGIEMKISKRQREKRYLYYRAAAGEISEKIRETVSSDL